MDLWRKDDLIDDLIAHNAARYLPGMERPNMARIAYMGRTRWLEVVDGQARLAERRDDNACDTTT